MIYLQGQLYILDLYVLAGEVTIIDSGKGDSYSDIGDNSAKRQVTEQELLVLVEEKLILQYSNYSYNRTSIMFQDTILCLV